MTRRIAAAIAIGSLTSERALLEPVRHLARILGWMTYHPHLSRWSERGWPDVVVCRPPRVLFLELKSETGRVSAEQTQWIDALRACGLDARVVRPSDLDEIAAMLR